MTASRRFFDSYIPRRHRVNTPHKYRISVCVSRPHHDDHLSKCLVRVYQAFIFDIHIIRLTILAKIVEDPTRPGRPGQKSKNRNMNNGSLNYESLKTIILHTEANLRIKMNQRMPKIRCADKAVPLRVNSLELEEYSTTINNSYYILGIYRNFQTTEDVPQFIKMFNDRCGVPYDLDKYGFKMSSYSSPILPGDVSFREENRIFLPKDTDEVERRYERRLQLNDGLEPNRQDFIRFNLLPFHYQRNNIQPPYSSCIRFTLKQEHQKRVEQYSYNIKLFEAAKELNHIIFDGRSVIKVNKFEMRGTGIVHRLPIGFKVSANRISIRLEYISRVAAILESTSSSLKKLELLYMSKSFENLQHDVVMNAKKLLFQLEDFTVLSTALKNLPNKNIEIHFARQIPTLEQYYGFIQCWMSTQREIGSSYSFGLVDEKMGNSLLNLVRARNEITEQTARCVTIIKEERKRKNEIILKENQTQKNQRFEWFFEVSFLGVKYWF
ncbi:Protein CBG19538 [Caenorhabditis briggsae]|uniref:Protein CBG19538 n=1 Tax=Caenorhabditis briggsae TaxID=6238 RepID=A8XVU8_CAEBR|nr:Protein CBG19538 [Caenorhabditis briggsae]CAP36767.2 Protein CBG19538 [Caenorhabditis briggsae]